MSSLAETMDALMEMGPQGIARFQESLEPEWIEEALEATGTASVRRRKLPAEQASCGPRWTCSSCRSDVPNDAIRGT